MKKYLKEFERLVGIMGRLRGKKGCEWDRQQTYESLVKYLFEESDELKLAVNNKDAQNMKEELGDVLMQVIFYAQIAKERKDFDIAGVIKGLNEKLIRRHPHVFSDYKVNGTEDIVRMWAEVKAKEKIEAKATAKRKKTI